MKDLGGKKICILATDGFEQSELLVPRDKLAERGAAIEIVAPDGGSIRAWDKDNWGQDVQVDTLLEDAVVGDYDALVLPGGQINPDLLRLNEEALQLIRDFHGAGKPIAAICHAPWLLIETGLAKGRRMTGYYSIRTDMVNAGAQCVDESVVVDGNIITSRKPDDLDDFVEAIAAKIKTKQDEPA